MIEEYIVYQGKRISFMVDGTGPPLVFIHGLNLDKYNCNCGVFKNLTLKYQVISIDLPGYGKSEELKNISFNGFEEIINMVTKKLGINYFCIAGYCLGGIISFDYTIRNSDKVKDLFLYETMIYLPWWMNICLFDYFKDIYDFIFKNKVIKSLFLRLNLIRINKLSNKRYHWNYSINVKYLRLMKKYQKINHLKRAEGLKNSIFIINAKRTYKNVKKTSANIYDKLDNVNVKVIEGYNHFDFINE